MSGAPGFPSCTRRWRGGGRSPSVLSPSLSVSETRAGGPAWAWPLSEGPGKGMRLGWGLPQPVPGPREGAEQGSSKVVEVRPTDGARVQPESECPPGCQGTDGVVPRQTCLLPTLERTIHVSAQSFYFNHENSLQRRVDDERRCACCQRCQSERFLSIWLQLFCLFLTSKLNFT